MKNIIFILLIAFFTTANAQRLHKPVLDISHHKISYIILLDGTKIKGFVSRIKTKGGLITSIKIKDSVGIKHLFMVKNIKSMYLPPKELNNKITGAGIIKKLSDWNIEKTLKGLVFSGYGYFELTDVIIRKEKSTRMMQLLNPKFNEFVKIYNNPQANKSSTFSIDNTKVSGGIATSYYISIDNKPTFKIKKASYKKMYKTLWSKCSYLVNTYPKKKWKNLGKHAYSYSKCRIK